MVNTTPSNDANAIIDHSRWVNRPAIAAGIADGQVFYADLDSGLLMKNDPFSGVVIERGRMLLPDEPGLGVRRTS